MSRFFTVFILFCCLSAVFAQYEQSSMPYDAAPVAYDAYPQQQSMMEQPAMPGYSAPLPEPAMIEQYSEVPVGYAQETAPIMESESPMIAEPETPSMVETESDAFIESECTEEGCPSRRPAGRTGHSAAQRRSLLRNRRNDMAPQYKAQRKHMVRKQPFGSRNTAGTHAGAFRCIGGGCERAAAGRRRPATGTRSNPAIKTDKLSVAFQAVKEELMSRAQELRSEKKWSGAVEHLVKNYRKKVHKVQDHIDELKKETRNLLRKKKQIQNAQLQNKLTSKLRIAQANMSLLQKQLTHITNKESEFVATERNLKQTVRQLQLHLRKLKGASEPSVKHHKYK